ncbi:ribonuclease E/G [Parvularcula sp. IMCC14364]|uniref:ribonuclease E/G n=1 Tax=Parvularcula sp. IMCC14364 TaxID=3067902 RepID=UPI0027418142|nr:ribonuclease E/G [Parvularcula sp. IMCC14364]
MTATLLIEESPAETRAALLLDGQVRGLWYSDDAAHSGLFLGKVKTVDRKLQAAFVDIGFSEAGFLPITESLKISEGQSLPVRIKRPAVPGKGPLLTTQTGVKAPTLEALQAKAGEAPARLEPVKADAVLAYMHFQKAMPTEIIVAGSNSFLALQAYLRTDAPTTPPELSTFPEAALFEREGIEEEIEQALARVVTLPGGGRLVFDEAEALTVIDVDVAATEGQSKRGSMIRACAEAIPEIFRQLSLRRIGGQVVIDFPALALKGGGQIRSVLKESARALHGARLIRLDDTGLAIYTLPRQQASLLDLQTVYHGGGPVRGRQLSPKALAARLLRKAAVQLQQHTAARLEVLGTSEVIDLIKVTPDWVQKLTAQYGARLTFSARDDKEREWSDVREIN